MEFSMTSRVTRAIGTVAFGAGVMAFTAVDAKTITVWCWDPNFNVAIMKEAGARYSKAHPDVTVNIVDFAKADVEQKLQTTLSSGVTSSLPDIVLIEDNGAQKYLQSFPGAFAPLSDKIDMKKFSPYKVEVGTLQGKVYNLPFDSGVTGFYYRKDYMAAAGIKPEDLQNITWDKYIEIGKAVEAKTGKKMMGLDPNDGGFVRLVMQSAGKWYFDKDGKPTIEGNPALKAALETTGKIIAAGITKPANGWNDWVSKFTSGDVAAVVTGVWITGTIKAQKDQAGKWGVAPLPSLSIPGAVNASNLGGSSWYVLAKGASKDEAINLLSEVFAKDVDFYQKILVDQGAVGSFLPALGGPAYQTADEFFGGEKVWAKFAEWLAKVPIVSYGVFTNEVDAAVTKQIPAIGKGANVDEALKAIMAQVKNQIQ